MIYLIFAVLITSTIVATFKLFDRFKIDNLQAITTNYVIAAGFGWLIMGNETSITDTISQPWFNYSIVVGCMFILVFNIFALSAQKAGVAITAVTSKMSVIIPVILGFIVFGETITLQKIFGIIMALCAFYLIFKKDKGLYLEPKLMILPILLFLGNGTNDSTMSYIRHTFQLNSQEQVILLLNVIFTVALFIGVAILTTRTIITKKPIEVKNILAGIWLGALNFASTYYFFRALAKFDNAVFFPIFNVSIVACSALLGLFFFKEKLRTINWIGIGLAIFAILTIAMA